MKFHSDKGRVIISFAILIDTKYKFKDSTIKAALNCIKAYKGKPIQII